MGFSVARAIALCFFAGMFKTLLEDMNLLEFVSDRFPLIEHRNVLVFVWGKDRCPMSQSLFDVYVP